MRRFPILFLALAATSHSAQTPWCAPSTPSPNLKLYYPPIAKAAHVSGTTIGRVISNNTGSVIRYEPIRGPIILSASIANQLQPATSQNLNNECITLLITDFTLGDQPQTPLPPALPGIIRLAIHGETIWLIDPAAELGSTQWRHRLKRIFQTLTFQNHR